MVASFILTTIMSSVFLLLLLLLQLCCFSSGAFAIPHARIPSQGLDEAVRLIKRPLHNIPSIKDVILTGVADRWESQAYKLQILRQRIGYAWELVLTDFGFQRHSTGVDLIHPRRRLAIELKNSCRISSSVKRSIRKLLKDFKRTHPTYTVIFGCINYRNLATGGTSVRGGITYMKGTSLLQHFLQSRKAVIVRRLKGAAREFMRHN